MSTKNLSAASDTSAVTAVSDVAADLIESYGNTVKNVIDAYRAGGEHVLGLVEQHWSRTMQEPYPPLTAVMVKNGSTAQRSLKVCYIQGLEKSSKNAQEMVNQFANFASQGVERLAANASMFEKKTGLHAFSLLSQVTLPGASVLVTLATQIEQKTANIASRFAHDDVSTTTVKRSSSFSRKRPARAN